MPPWRLGRVAGWATVALAGDPILLLIPPFIFSGLMLATFGIGAPGRAEVLLPLVSLPPVDAFQDVVLIDLSSRAAFVTWALRVAALLIRTIAFGILLSLAVQRARGGLPTLGEAIAFVRGRFRTIAFLELVSFAIFAVPLSLSADLTSTRDDGAIGTALLFGVLLLIGAFVAAASEEAAAGAAIRSGLRRLRRRPLGHIVLVLAFGVVSNGLFRLATIGEPGRTRAVPLTLYAFLATLATMWFLLAFSRRQILIDETGRVEAATPADQAKR